MPQMIAKVDLHYGGRVISKDDSFEVEERFALILVGLGRAELAAAPATHYATRDMAAPVHRRKRHGARRGT